MQLKNATAMLCLVACAKAPGTAADFVRREEGAHASPPSVICQDDSIPDDGLCFPGEAMQRWLQTGELTFVDSEEPPAGISGLMKLLTRITHEDLDEPLYVWVKWKPANASLTALNNAPRKERAAFEFQRLFLPDDRWVVPPTVMRCIDPAPGHEVPKRAMADEVDCVFGQVSYWVSPVDNPGEVDVPRYDNELGYRRSLGDMNLLTYGIGHGDAHKDNWLISTDPDRPRALSPDNGVAFSGFGNPMIKNEWGSIALEAYPDDSIDALRELTSDDLDTLRVFDTFEVTDDRQLRRVEPDRHHLGPQGDAAHDGRVSLGLRPGEIRRIHRRIDRLLQKVEQGELQTYPSETE